MTAYDELPYPDRPHPLTHPDHLAVLARLWGLSPREPRTARVLELGTGDGGNLVAMAVTRPDARFVGVDLASAPIARGLERVRALGLSNVQLESLDLLEIGASFGQFDYVIAHGLYSWTPAVVRDHILAIARNNLAPNGLAVVSYHTLPGGHVRQILREAMFNGCPSDATAPAVIAHARERLTQLTVPRPRPTPLDAAIAAEAAGALRHTDAELFHDHLASTFEPFRVCDFVDHARRHGLRYVDDASVVDTHNPRLAESVVAAVEARTVGDRLAREQTLDMLRGRRFRQSVLCHDEAPLDAAWRAERAAGLFVASGVRETEPDRFSADNGIAVRVTHPALLDILQRLIRQWPEDERVTEADAEAVLALFRRGLVDLRPSPGQAGRAGERPRLTPLARFQIEHRAPELFSLLHRPIALEGEEVRAFLVLMDGHRDRAALARDGRCSRAEVDARLERLGRSGLIVREG